MRLRQTYLYSSIEDGQSESTVDGRSGQRWYLYFWMVWSNTKADQTIRRRQSLIHVDAGIWHLLQHAVCGIEARGS